MEMSGAFSDLLAVREVIGTQSALEAQLKQRIQQRMGDATRAVFETGRFPGSAARMGHPGYSAVAQDQPELAQTYAVTKPGVGGFWCSSRCKGKGNAADQSIAHSPFITSPTADLHQIGAGPLLFISLEGIIMLKGLALTPRSLAGFQLGRSSKETASGCQRKMTSSPSPARCKTAMAGSIIRSMNSYARTRVPSCVAFLCACCLTIRTSACGRITRCLTGPLGDPCAWATVRHANGPPYPGCRAFPAQHRKPVHWPRRELQTLWAVERSD